MDERDDILQKINDHAWASSMRDQLVARVQNDLNSYESDRDAYLRDLPIDWSRTTPRFFTNSGVVNNVWRHKLDMAQDCSVIYYLTGDPRYAALGADVLHNSVRWLLRTPKDSNTSIGGWTFHDREWLYESRAIGSPMPIIYDFLHGYLQSNTVWDVHQGLAKSFSFTEAQDVFDQFRELCATRGYAGTNWSALMGDCMILNTLALDNVSTRNGHVDDFLFTNFQRQDSVKLQNDDFDGPAPYSCYKESLGYAVGVVERNSYYIMLLDRYDPAKNYPGQFPKLIQSMHRTRQMHYPNNSYQLLFGDGQRLKRGNLNYSLTDIVYSQAKKNDRTTLMNINGGLLADGLVNGKYNRGSLREPGGLDLRNQILPLLWGEPVVNEQPETLEEFRTDTLPFAGLALQRNLSPSGNPDDGLMCFVQGAGFVHSHASGMNMELYGEGRVLGVKGYGRTKYARSFASANTVIVNGYSRGVGGWGGIKINTVQLKAMEPATREDAVSPNLSFTTSTFADNKGDGAEANQERTMAIVRTSPSTGFYFDLFRSDSSKSGEFHDYLYHNVGDTLTVTDSSGSPLSLTSQPNRFQNDNDSNQSPGWGYLTETKATGTVSDSVRAQFKTRFDGDSADIYMDVHIPGDSEREYATAMAPSDGENPSPYYDEDIPTLIIRKNGQAWNSPFGVIYEPHKDGVDGGTVQNVELLRKDSKVVGMFVESLVDGQAVFHSIIAHTGANDVYEDPSKGLYFKGRFGIASHREDGSGELYLGEGSSLSYGPLKVTSNSGGNTEASVLFDENLTTEVTANSAVTVEMTGLSFAPDSGPIAHWPLDEGSGNAALDASISGSDGVLLNGASWGSDNIRGSFVVFDGTDDRIETTFRYALSDDDDFTWAWWAKKEPGSHPSSIMVGNRYGNMGSENLEFIKMMPSKGAFANTASAAGIEDYNYSDLPASSWNHYAMVKSGTNYQWYVDGVAQGAPVTINYNESSPLPFLIGGDDDGSGTKVNEHFEGAIDDVVLYRKALTASEVVDVSNGSYFPVITLTSLGSPVFLDDNSVWSDGAPAHSGADYVVPAGGNLRSLSGNSIFPGNSLTIEAGGRYQVRSLESNGEVNTVDQLILKGGSGFSSGDFAELAAGTGSGESNVLDGRITQSGSSRLLTNSGSIARQLKVLSQIEGDGTLQIVGEGTTIANPGNTFSGTWETSDGSRLVFESGEAVGSAGIIVQTGGLLEIKGNWTAEAPLSVSDTSNTEIVIGPHQWKLSSLTLGSTPVAEGIYSTSELGALGNARFTGTGRITVGNPVLVQAVIAGWDDWNSATAPSANVTAPGITASATASTATGNWSITDGDGRGSSGDGSWGSFESNESPASLVTSGSGVSMTALNAVTSAQLTLNIANNGPSDWKLDALHLDVIAFRPNAPRAYQLEVVSGDITTGVVFTSGDDVVSQVGGNISASHDQHDEVNVSLIGLPDSTLEAGGSAVLRITFTSGTGDGGGHHLFLDNVAISGTTSPMSEQEGWRLEYFGTTANTGPAADDSDANLDGESNLLEFATGQNPHVPTRLSTPLTMNANSVQFHYPRSKAALADGITFAVKWSDTLQSDDWNTVGVTSMIDPQNPGDSEVDNIIATVPMSLTGKRFIRLEVTAP